MAENPPRQDPGPPYTWPPSFIDCPLPPLPFLQASRQLLHAELSVAERFLRARLGWREPVRAVNTSCPAANHCPGLCTPVNLVLWHAPAETRARGERV